MKKALKPILIVSAVLIISGVIAIVCLLTKGQPVETEEEAIAIATEYATKKYDRDFSKDEVTVSSGMGIWIVTFKVPRPKKEGVAMLGGVGPLVIIEQETGKIIYCSKMGK